MIQMKIKKILSIALLTACIANSNIAYADDDIYVLLNGEDVNTYIRTEEVGGMASASSTNPDVRAQLLDLQRDLAKNNNCLSSAIIFLVERFFLTHNKTPHLMTILAFQIPVA